MQVMLTLQLQSSWDWIPNHTLMPGTPNCILNIVVPLQVVTINTVLIDDDSIILIPANSNSRCCYAIFAALCHRYQHCSITEHALDWQCTGKCLSEGTGLTV